MKDFLSLIFVIFVVTSLQSGAGDFVARDGFTSPELSSQWKAAKGEWKIVDGMLSGRELAADKHAAVLTYQEPHTNAKVRLSFQMKGSTGFQLSFNHLKGHLYRVVVGEKESYITMDKDKKDPASKAVMLQKKASSFEVGKTYVMTCETTGDKVKVDFDNGFSLEGSHPDLTRAKTGFRLVVRGDGMLFDDFTILSKE